MRGQMPENMLQPAIVGVADWRYAVFPAGVFTEAIAAPIGYVERWVGEDVVEAKVLELVLVELPSLFQRMSASMPRTARFIFARRQVV